MQNADNIGILPDFFKFKSATDLIRIGKNNDGGYLVSRADIEKSNLLISLGLSDDWSFECNFTKYNNVETYSYDASVNFQFWLKSAIVNTIRNPLNLLNIRKIISYYMFFNGKRKHIQKFVGLDTKNDLYLTLSDVIKKQNIKNIFLKIDIEGDEFRLLDEIIHNHDVISGLVIELHDCDIHLGEIENFIKKFPLKLVHIHANNFSPVREPDKLPIVLELSFSKYAKTKDIAELPHFADMPNNRNKPEIELQFNK